MCCSVLQCVPVWCSVLQCAAKLLDEVVGNLKLWREERQFLLYNHTDLWCGFALPQNSLPFCNKLQHTATRCYVLQCIAVHCSVSQCVTVRCSVLQRVAECCSAMQDCTPYKIRQEIIFDLPFGFPINNINSLSTRHPIILATVHVTLAHVTWPIQICVKSANATLAYITWLVHVCATSANVTAAHVTLERVTWFIRMCVTSATLFLHTSRDSSKCVPRQQM